MKATQKRVTPVMSLFTQKNGSTAISIDEIRVIRETLQYHLEPASDLFNQIQSITP